MIRHLMIRHLMIPGLALLVLATPDPLRGSSQWPWQGAAWADYRALMSPITARVKNRLQIIRAAGTAQGRIEGRMGQIGDSITHAGPYFRNAVLDGPSDNETGHDYSAVRSWLAYSGAMPADAFSFYRDHGKEPPYGNFSGWKVVDAQAAGHPAAAVTLGDGVTPGDFSWALLMFGTNDIDPQAWEPVAWAADYSSFVHDFIDLGVIPVLSTIPPEVAHLADGRVEVANEAIRAIAAELGVPCVEFYELILHYQPTDWHGTLISLDGTHPSAGGGGWDFSQGGLTTTDGYAARTKLTFDFAEKLRGIVFENGPPEPTPNELLSDDFETGDTSSWSQAFPASALEVTATAAFSGDLGLAVTLDGCAPETLDLTALGGPVSGELTACDKILAGDVEVVAPGATLVAGTLIELADGFWVRADAHLTTGLVAELAEPFAFIEDDSPIEASSYGAAFHADLGSLSLASGDELDLFAGFAADGGTLFRLILEHDAGSGGERLALAARLGDGTSARTAPGEELLLPPGYNMIDVSWRAGDGSGELRVTVNSSASTSLEDLFNDSRRLSSIRLGAVGGIITASSGTFHIDEFQSWE